MNAQNLTKQQRAAILVMALGEDAAAVIINAMSPQEIEKLGKAMAGLGAIPVEVTDQVINDFFAMLSR